MLTIFVTLIPGSTVVAGMTRTTERVGHDELATLKLVALDGALDGRTTVTCAALADRLEASPARRVRHARSSVPYRRLRWTPG